MRVADLTRSLEFYAALAYQAIGIVPETSSGSLTMLKLPDEEFVSFELVHKAGRKPVDPARYLPSRLAFILTAAAAVSVN